MAEDDFMPHKAIEEAKKNIELLKKKAGAKKVSSTNLLRSINKLSANMDSLSELFKTATEEMKKEEAAEEELTEEIIPLSKKINMIEDENKKIAQGILTVADMIKELKDKIERQMPAAMPSRPIPQPRIMPGQMPAKPMPAPEIRPGAMPPRHELRFGPAPRKEPGAPYPEMPSIPPAFQKPIPPTPPKPAPFPPLGGRIPPAPGMPPRAMPGAPEGMMPEFPKLPGAEPPKKQGFFSKILGVFKRK